MSASEARGDRHTLLLRLAGPMQSWGIQSRFQVRDAGREPSKSGVVGLLCAALGRPRTEPVDDLAALRLGVRVDREGRPMVDYQTAGGTHHRGDDYGVLRADGTPGGTVVSRRYYLADADFLVGLEGDDLGLLEQLAAAVARPFWPLCLGRKAFVPGVPIRLRDGGLRPGQALDSALLAEPWTRIGKTPPERRPEQLRLVLEVGASGEVRTDQPVGAAFADRRFAPRFVATSLEPLGTAIPVREGER